jgi:hypothetical protein
MIWKIRDKSYLICVLDKTVKSSKTTETIEESLAIIEQSKGSNCNFFFILLFIYSFFSICIA